MNAAREAEKEAALDQCIDRLLAGGRWQAYVPDGADDEAFALMKLAERISTMAHVTAAPELARRQRMRTRLGGQRSLLHRVAFYRLPYLPPLWIHREAC